MIQTRTEQELFFSQFRGMRIYDGEKQVVGKVRDMAVQWNGSPPVATCIKYSRGIHAHIDLSHVDRLTEMGLILNTSLKELVTRDLRDDEIYVSRWLLDKQIIDKTGAKLVRVNDIKLTWNNQKIILVAVDIGIRGLLRRLGLEFIMKNRPNKFVDWQCIIPLQSKSAHLQLRRIYSQLSKIHPADMADIMEDMDYRERHELMNNMDNRTVAEALTEAVLQTQLQIISQLDEERASDILEKMPTDEATDILGALPEEKSSQLLNKMDVDIACDVRKLMAYDEGVAGALMTTEFIAFPSTMTVRETIDHLRELAPDAEAIHYIYVVDERSVLQGVCPLGELILAHPDTILSEFMHHRLITVTEYDERQKVYECITKYNLLAVPIVNVQGIMLGIITINDLFYSLIPDRSRLKTFSPYMLTAGKGKRK